MNSRSKFNFDQNPYLILWELTRACALACKHCRAKAMKRRAPNELTLSEICAVLDQLQELNDPLVVFTGGDPSERPDLFEIISEAKKRDIVVAITPSATPSMSKEFVGRLKQYGVERLAISLDGSDAETHDAFRGVKGSFEITKSIIGWANEIELPIQINTSISRFNIDQFDKLSNFVSDSKAVLWSLFFLVPTGRANNNMQISPAETEMLMMKMAELADKNVVDIKATAAPHFRRVLIQTMQEKKVESLNPTMRLGRLRSYQSVNDGKGIMFISHTGDVYPSGFLPLAAGNVRTENVLDIYRSSPLFQELRNPELLKGKCGACRYKSICGGSRARAYAETGDYLMSDSLCPYDERAFLLRKDNPFFLEAAQ
ncbi:MAG: TIGR04053 family radical SAM/SPASM domain-containing protein [Candidatus Obscuribacterales bacterium]|nr:TIGR04053 family radical SAM/SPASM domain-containing protein [Candidatus Obscuribacterales bacterium]